jgi:Transport and Golgi organisation 2
MCTVLLRFRPDQPWPLLIAAVRDEFLERPWDPPAAHWPDAPAIVGGHDRTAGGTWLAVRTSSADPSEPPAVAALLNGVRLPELEFGTRPSRGRLPLTALTDPTMPDRGVPDRTDYDGFHLLLGTPSTVKVWSWDGRIRTRQDLPPGDHIVVNLGVDTVDDPLVPHFAPLFAALPDPPLTGEDTAEAWGPWLTLLRGDGLAGDDPRALIVRKEFDGTEPGAEGFAGRVYGSGSATLVAISADRVRYDFTATPATPQWTSVSVKGRAPC